MGKNWLITGGAGFIGANLVTKLLLIGEKVAVIDDLSRGGSEANLRVLQNLGLTTFFQQSITDFQALRKIAEKVDEVHHIVHLAGQVSLLASIENPRLDFEVNALGTLNVLEIMREFWPHSRLAFSSTNKVYGDLARVKIRETDKRYEPVSAVRSFDTTTPLDFHGGYGVSKGCADQYVCDYSRMFGLSTVVLRQSAICGKLQHPKVDQGWASFLVRETLANRKIQLNGVGKQVRDLLDVDDLVSLIILIMDKHQLPEMVYNVGGGIDRSLSLLEFMDSLRERNLQPTFETGNLRPSDQLYYVSDITRAMSDFNWEPRYGIDEIVDRLIAEELSVLN